MRDYNRGPWFGPEHAARFIWLNRAGFNGLYRENRHGKFNVPIGSYARLSLPEPSAFWEVSQALQGVEIVAGGYAAILDRVGPRDQVYCDPPYLPLTDTACFTAYSKEPFNLDDQQRLANLARDAAGRGAKVVLSNHDVPIVREHLYAEKHGFELRCQQVHRAISRNGADRRSVAEVIAVIGPQAPALATA